MMLYIALIVLALIGYAAHEFVMTRDLRPALPVSPQPRNEGVRETKPAARRLPPFPGGTRVAFNPPNATHPLSLTRELAGTPEQAA